MSQKKFNFIINVKEMVEITKFAFKFGGIQEIRIHWMRIDQHFYEILANLIST